MCGLRKGFDKLVQCVEDAVPFAIAALLCCTAVFWLSDGQCAIAPHASVSSSGSCQERNSRTLGTYSSDWYVFPALSLSLSHSSAIFVLFIALHLFCFHSLLLSDFFSHTPFFGSLTRRRNARRHKGKYGAHQRGSLCGTPPPCCSVPSRAAASHAALCCCDGDFFQVKKENKTLQEQLQAVTGQTG